MINPYNFGQDVSHPHSDRAGLERDHRLGLAQGDASKVPASPISLCWWKWCCRAACLEGTPTGQLLASLSILARSCSWRRRWNNLRSCGNKAARAFSTMTSMAFKIFKDWCHLIFLCNPGTCHDFEALQMLRSGSGSGSQTRLKSCWGAMS